MAIRFLFLMVTAFALVIGKPEYKDCSPSKETCEYWFVVREKLTMIYKQDLVIPHDGKLFKYDDKYRKTEVCIKSFYIYDFSMHLTIHMGPSFKHYGLPIVILNGISTRSYVKRVSGRLYC